MTPEYLNDRIPGEAQKQNPLQIPLKWALIATLLSVIQTMTFLSLSEGSYNPRPEGWAAILSSTFILFFPMIMAIREFREKQMEGYLGFGQAFRCGWHYTLFQTLFVLLFYIVLYNFIIDWDTFLSEQLDRGIEMMKKRGMSDESIRQRLADSPAWLSTQWFSLLMLVLAGLLYNTFINLIISAIFKRKRPNA